MASFKTSFAHDAHFPHSEATPSSRLSSRIVVQPEAAALRISRSVTPLQMQMYTASPYLVRISFPWRVTRRV